MSLLRNVGLYGTLLSVVFFVSLLFVNVSKVHAADVEVPYSITEDGIITVQFPVNIGANPFFQGYMGGLYPSGTYRYAANPSTISVNDNVYVYDMDNMVSGFCYGGGASDCSAGKLWWRVAGTYVITGLSRTSSAGPGQWTPFDNLPLSFQNGQYETRFTNLSVTGTSSITLGASWYVDSDEYNSTIAELNPQLIQFSVSYGTTTDFYSKSESMGTVPGAGTTTTSLGTLSDGVYDVIAKFYNYGAAFGGPVPFRSSYILTRFTVSGGVLTSVDTPENYDYTTFADTNTLQPCSITEIGGCISNSVRFLFIPTEYELQTFFETATSVQSKFPFAYAYDFYDVSSTLFNSSTTEDIALTLPFGDLGSTTIISTAQLEAVPFASSLRSIIAGLIWMMFAFFVYRKTLVIFNRT